MASICGSWDLRNMSLRKMSELYLVEVTHILIQMAKFWLRIGWLMRMASKYLGLICQPRHRCQNTLLNCWQIWKPLADCRKCPLVTILQNPPCFPRTRLFCFLSQRYYVPEWFWYILVRFWYDFEIYITHVYLVLLLSTMYEISLKKSNCSSCFAWEIIITV